MVQEFSIRSSYLSRRLRLTTLIRLRWLAVAGQSIAVLFVALYLKFPFPVSICFALIACSAWLNLLLSFRYPINHRLEPRAAITVLAFDILQVAGLLYMTGGLQNPFAVLMIVPVIISATSLPASSTVTLGVLVTVCATALAYFHLPLPWYPDQALQLPFVLIAGVWCSVVSALVFTAVYAYRVAEEARLLADALTATELILQREQHLSALDGLAAAAAHELGTPLATIALVAKEMQRALAQDDRFAEDIELLRSQTDRCREILKRLTSLSSESEEHMSRLKISSLIEEVIEPNRNFGISIEVTKLRGEGNEPVIRRNPGIIYGLGNLVENAVDFARETIQVSWGWTDKTVQIVVADDGKGFPADILDRIGEPYTTGRDRETNEHGGGLGLGLFIAKTLLERSGAAITFRNRNDPGQGAEVVVTWPRNQLDEQNG
ncbi:MULTISPECIES: ActS/PrrB/RegB family redox-sensitive histidine kinase [Phyllobacterium]|jgi:two-component system, sensor histidine kinase RegB|uniref:ActS/PrrB/RegB family redox-sensitive histidine kinase n=1 Tax=Phyllobacterium TaxID=28100 RepID=UPI001AC1A561|nr:ActS/PrrB/RegB family redox-sensitive histidine kinase [Phyllobacterium calauticae]MBN9135467.1 ActS/PrrB/RegB family redox-sensitive histidine kinase [Phyllobacterium sp.]MBZ3691993.1 ActS/PrrB/RegB family redox-sensitive histidine kinase [Phyllobacterium calauticae]|eukprot:gene8986-11006_t